MNTAHGAHGILRAITPSYKAIDADELKYPYLRRIMNSYEAPSFLKRRGFELIPDSLDVRTPERREHMRVADLLSAAYHLQQAWTAPEKLFWSAQFTKTSVQLFGRPLSGETAKLARDEKEKFESIAAEFPDHRSFFSPVIDAYESLCTRKVYSSGSIEKRYQPLMTELGDIVTAQYSEVFKKFDMYAPHALLDADDLLCSFTECLAELQRMDERWKTWHVVKDKGAKLCVEPRHRQIVIGKHRQPVPASEVRGLFAHEVLVHALRAKEGEKLSSELAMGMPDYIAAEEGLGVLIESAVNGGIADKVKDRYIDIALALGGRFRRPYSRSEMFNFCFIRSVMRSVARGDETDIDELEAVTWEHVNRIYRGSLGNRYVGVFTKDVTYYKGFIKMANYLERQKAKVGLSAALRYVMQGKFDPTNTTHRQALESHKAAIAKASRPSAPLAL